MSESDWAFDGKRTPPARIAVPSIALGGLAPMASCPDRTSTGPVWIRAARAFDGELVREETWLCVEGDRIRYVDERGPDAVEAPGELIDLGPSFVLPGLIDAHVHLAGSRGYGIADSLVTRHDLAVLRAAEDCSALLWNGYTSVRDAGSMTALALRDAVEEGTIAGPSILAAGPIICQTGGHADHHFLPLEQAREWPGCILADGTDACRQAVRRAVREGCDLIKFCTTGGIGSARDNPADSHFTLGEAQVMVDEAHRLGRRVAAHAQGTAGILTALHAGADTIEHATYLTDECVALARKTGASIVPTVALREAFVATLEKGVDLPEWRRRKQRRAIDAIAAGFRLACDAGLTVAAGSDFTGAPCREHGRNAREPISMVALGMPAVTALKAATSVAAGALGQTAEIGYLRPGYRADIVAVDADPTADIDALQAIIFVMRNGRIHRWTPPERASHD